MSSSSFPRYPRTAPVSRIETERPVPFLQCLTGLQQCAWPEAVELVSLLSRYEIEGLLFAHDRIAEAGSISTAPLSESMMPDDQEGLQESAFITPPHLAGPSPTHSQQYQDRTYKIIRLEKSNEPLVIESL